MPPPLLSVQNWSHFHQHIIDNYYLSSPRCHLRPTSQAGVISEQLNENMDKEKKILGRTDVQIKRIDQASDRASVLAGSVPPPKHYKKTQV